MAVAQPLDFEIDFARNLISRPGAWFLVIVLKFIFTAIFEIENHVKKFLGTKKNAQRPYRQRRQYPTPKAWEFIEAAYKPRN